MLVLPMPWRRVEFYELSVWQVYTHISHTETLVIAQYVYYIARQNSDILQLVTLITPYRQTMIDPLMMTANLRLTTVFLYQK